MRLLIFTLGLLFCDACCFADAMQDALKEGKSFGKERSKGVIEAIKNTKIEESNNGETFNAENAREMLLLNQKPKSDVRDFILSPDVQKNQKENKGFTNDEYFLERGDDIVEAAENGMEEVKSLNEYEQVKCVEAVDLIPITIERELKVSVNAPQSKELKICKGHRIKKKWYKKSKINVKAEYEKFKIDLENNPLTKSVIFEYPHHHHNRISVWYNLIHADNASCCDHFQVEIQQQDTNPEVADEWIYADESLLSLMQSPDCMLVKQECIDADSTRIINGKEVKRSCWKERLSFLSHQKSNNDCEKLKSKKCDLIEKTCLKQGINGCALWELTYKCYTKLGSTIRSKDNNLCLNQENWETSYEPNQSLADITTKIAVFEEIEREMEKSQGTAENIHIFDAKKMKCSKAIASDLIYDCCFSQKGLATKVGLAKCNADELALSEMREKGVCHYVGNYSETMLGIKTEDKHVFCCFESKLAKIINEQGRNQIGMEWGSARHPNCKGFTLDELGNLDFSKLDLSEVFQDFNKNKSQNSESKISDFEERLKTRIKRMPAETQSFM